MATEPSPIEWTCPACGSDWIEGIDPGEYFDGEQGWCGDCQRSFAATCFVGEDGSESWAFMLNDVEDDEREPLTDITGCDV